MTPSELAFYEAYINARSEETIEAEYASEYEDFDDENEEEND